MKRLLILVPLLAFGCVSPQVTPKVEAGLSVIECELDNVRALVPSLELADAVVTAALRGDYAGAVTLLVQLGMTGPEVNAVGKAFASCRPAEEHASIAAGFVL